MSNIIDKLITPYGGDLVNLHVDQKRAEALCREAIHFPSLDLNQRQLSDLELLLNGGFSPLRGFMNQADYNSVLNNMSLADGTFWPIPITLDIPDSVAQQLTPGSCLALRDPEGFMLAVITVEELWQPDRRMEAHVLFSSDDPAHPAVAQLLQQKSQYAVTGHLEGLSLPLRHDFPTLHLTPEELRKSFAQRGWHRIIAFQAHQPLHRLQHEITLRYAMARKANLLIHPVIGNAKSDHPNYFTLIRCYQAIMPRFSSTTTALSLLPLYPRGSGLREVFWKAIVQRNYGCSHLIVGGEYKDNNDARRGIDLFHEYNLPANEAKRNAVGIELIPFPRMVYVEERAQYLPVEEVPESALSASLTDIELKRRMTEGLKIPEWLSYPEVLNELRIAYPTRDKQGLTIFFTGLSGAGKSTLAKVLMTKLLEMGGRQVTLLDGDIMRKHLSSELGFSREHRDLNVRRIGYVASEITKNHGIAICAPIAPYDATRRDVRLMIEPLGGFFEVHVATPLHVCEGRDRKGLYAKARAGIVKEFTGISDPYETPENPELVIDTTNINVEEAVHQILLKLEREGYLHSSRL
ncbi:Sulfate adenylyltransferase, dissimilatory-type [Candidatus Nitrotoga sp. HW29]|uniref:bifunctional sulfate adenylyltransferase/adenylylsulfate kinase n=1 Tax=Candidatus Nitrotoga sp. HW29 TaxID=2886963 RepID=UPI001EF37369|nr:bifunctional sulfate adenylyltransferase/adenylylsulfate kinase [Candidatus Nitrotoga sp. HW29]CAH1905300.1 Sulfate adenylyltransferase, dissimilatory-type [Candidatus Nitrotoga sp. HW29]